MLKLEGKNIQITRGDILQLTISADNEVDGNLYEFQIGDVIRFKIMQVNKVENVLLEKDFPINEISTEKQIEITADEMKIGELINKSKDYWYEIELNPDTEKTQTIVGYEINDKGKPDPAILTLLPEGGDKT
ncbi:MAG: hypothetical protein ACI4VQ_03920 [Clostridia bacterium]